MSQNTILKILTDESGLSIDEIKNTLDLDDHTDIKQLPLEELKPLLIKALQNIFVDHRPQMDEPPSKACELLNFASRPLNSH